MDDTEYFSRPELSFHKLQDFRKSPAYYYAKHISGEISEPPNDNFRLGRLIHMAILEPARFTTDVITVPPEHMTPGGSLSSAKKTREWLAECDSRDYATSAEVENLQRMAGAVWDNPMLLPALMGGRMETVHFGNINGVQCKSKIDMISHSHVWDLKSTTSIDDAVRQIRDYGYLEQLAFYSMVSGEELGGLIFVEKSNPWRTLVVEFEAPAIATAKSSVLAEIEKFRVTQERGVWEDPQRRITLTKEIIYGA